MSDLPYPALHASHGGVWIARAEGARAVTDKGPSQMPRRNFVPKDLAR